MNNNTQVTNQPLKTVTSSKSGLYSGRLNRIGFFVIDVITRLVLGHKSASSKVIAAIVLIIGIVFFISWSNRRMHDVDRSGWTSLVWLLPFVGAVAMLIWCLFIPGTKGPNKYGDIDSTSSSLPKLFQGK
jgi:uncharacterized membrane protein YhaH (DUF805 family)